MPGSDDHDALRRARTVGVYGLGREGTAIVRYLRTAAPDATVEAYLDGDPDDAVRTVAADLDVMLVGGADAVVGRLSSGEVDVVVRSPGVPLRGAGLAAARDHGVRVSSGTNLWFEREAPDNAVVVTGTKGKSTTSSLLAHLLAADCRDVALLGNIGRPLLDHDRAASDSDVVVVELSSYQLADLHEPISVGVWLNLHAEHLDWHGSHAAYARDKGRVVGLSRTKVPARPRETTRPVRRSACQAALTVAGETPSSAATSRTVGSRSPGARAPERIPRLKAPAMPRGERSSMAP